MHIEFYQLPPQTLRKFSDASESRMRTRIDKEQIARFLYDADDESAKRDRVLT